MSRGDLFREVQRRNAWLRAWRGVGVPVTGGWDTSHEHVTLIGRAAKITLGCSVCHETTSQYAYFGKRITTMYMQTKLKAEERLRLKVLVDTLRCPHLTRMLGRAPEELSAIWELELLTNG